MAASCFWQPARSNGIIAQAKMAGTVGDGKRLEALTDGCGADGVAFLLMGSPVCEDALAATRRRRMRE
ncbi:hypothetical protein [Mesorhizobium sp.]|uniref:hypothetical protein n=1 Tax=Mesorhizobium sp. TaxID=1871066 RepID=UPI0034571C2D